MIRNLELYKVFYHVAATSSLTKAAHELSITQPAVSQSMKQLEGQLGVKLFSRVGKGIRLTSEGELLFSYVAKGCDAFEEGEARLKNILDLNEGELRIGATDLAMKYYLPDYLLQFRNSFPNIRVKLLTQKSDQIEAMLTKGEIDLGLAETAGDPVSGSVSDSASGSVPGLHVQEVRKIRDIFVAGASYAYLRAPGLPYQLMTHLPLICYESGHPGRTLMDGFFARIHISMTPAYTFENADTILQFVSRDLGIGCLPEDYAGSAIDSGALIRLQFSPPMPERSLCLLYGDTTHESKAAAAMRNICLG